MGSGVLPDPMACGNHQPLVVSDVAGTEVLFWEASYLFFETSLFCSPVGGSLYRSIFGSLKSFIWDNWFAEFI